MFLTEKTDTCPVCRKQAYVGSVSVEANEGVIALVVGFFCDRTEGCRRHVFDLHTEQLIRERDLPR